MKVYLDSSALIKLYVSEAESVRVSDYVRALPQALPVSQLHDVEMRNGLRLKVFRREAATATVKKALKLMDDDRASGVVARPPLNWVDVYRQAEGLSETHTPAVGCRSLDLLHVASALVLAVSDFLTFDDRQANLAEKAGLRLVKV